VQDVAALGAICREKGIVFHVDAAQATGRVAVNLADLPIDLMSLTSHKTYGPKGIGALYVRRKPRVRIEAQMHGGGHERGMRSGTLPTHQAVGMGEAFRLAAQALSEESARLHQLRQRLLRGLAELPGVHLNGHPEHTVPGIVNLAFEGVDGETLLLSLRTLAVSSGSACMSATMEPSYVLRGIGLPDALAQSALRVSFGRFSTADDIDTAIAALRDAVPRLRAAV